MQRSPGMFYANIHSADGFEYPVGILLSTWDPMGAGMPLQVSGTMRNGV